MIIDLVMVVVIAYCKRNIILWQLYEVRIKVCIMWYEFLVNLYFCCDEISIEPKISDDQSINEFRTAKRTPNRMTQRHCVAVGKIHLSVPDQTYRIPYGVNHVRSLKHRSLVTTTFCYETHVTHVSFETSLRTSFPKSQYEHEFWLF